MTIATLPHNAPKYFLALGIPASLLIVLWVHGIDMLLAGPRGVHFIRQTDSLAFISYFRHYTTDLFTPGVLDLRNAPDAGRCAGEFPLIYWCIGMVERVAGDLPVLLKWINLSTVLMGHVLLVRALTRITGEWMLALGMGLLVFGSGVVAYYSCNYLPDAAAYGMVLIGWALVVPDLFTSGYKANNWTTCLFMLAGAIKAPMAMHLLTWILLPYLVGALGPDPKVIYHVRSMGVLILVGSWHFYARWYNALHGSDYFLTSAQPIWEMLPGELHHVQDLVLNYWWTKYLHPSVWHLLGLSTLFLLIRKRSLPVPVRTILLLLATFSTGFVLLFYRKLADHDYYFLTVMPLVVWLFAATFWSLNHSASKRWMRIALSLGCWAFGFSAILLARTEVQRRMSAPIERFSRTATVTTEIEQRMKVTPLSKEARVIVLGDSTTNAALLSVGRLGWTYPGYPVTGTADLAALRAKGATHILQIGNGSVNGLDPSRYHPIQVARHWALYELSK